VAIYLYCSKKEKKNDPAENKEKNLLLMHPWFFPVGQTPEILIY